MTTRSLDRACTGALALSFLALAAFACGATSDASDAGAGDDGGVEIPETDGLDDDASAPPPVPPADPPDAGGPTPIKYVLVLVKENHTFDNYFSGFPGAESAGPTAKLSTGKTVTRTRAPDGPLAKDPCHSNACGQTAYRSGGMNGFDLTGSGNLPFAYYDEKQIPAYWRYAREFVLADHHFSTTLGPSTPGHVAHWTGQSMVLDNAKCTRAGGTGCTGFGCTADAYTKITSYDPAACTTKTTAPCFDVPILTDHLPNGFTWMDYGGPVALMAKSVSKDPGYKAHFRAQGALVTDLEGGHIANLTIAHLWSGDASEHPAASPCVGENFSVDVINAAMKLPQWKEMAIVLTWDDWGGFYDHVAPPVHKCKNGEIFQQGFRLPLLVISPYAKKGYVLKTPTEQASVPRLVEELWGLPFMTARDPNARDGTAGSLMDAFDFQQSARAPITVAKRTCP